MDRSSTVSILIKNLINKNTGALDSVFITGSTTPKQNISKNRNAILDNRFKQHGKLPKC